MLIYSSKLRFYQFPFMQPRLKIAVSRQGRVRLDLLFRFAWIVVLLCLSGCKEDILHDLDELHANQIKLLLTKAGIKAEKNKNGTRWNISVPQKDSDQSLELIEESRLLRKSSSNATPQSKGLLVSKDERSRTYNKQIATTLEETLERVPNVIEARVHLAMEKGDEDSGRVSFSSYSASVLLVTKNHGSVDPNIAKELISGATGMPLAKVTVVVSPLNNSSVDNPLHTASPDSAKYLQSLTLDKNNTGKFSFGFIEEPQASLIYAILGVLLLLVLFYITRSLFCKSKKSFPYVFPS